MTAAVSAVVVPLWLTRTPPTRPDLATRSPRIAELPPLRGLPGDRDRAPAPEPRTGDAPQD
ncbi:hypothetical protein ACH40E_41705 [Streptomyces acidicola]|uniref:hypothetical protein n=1 Tax=Streptomyces acidicola TaxID=2596892 RepID=UPI0037B7573A